MRKLAERIASSSFSTMRANMLLPGLYAWLTTVAYPTTQRGAPSAARFSAFAALVALLAGPILAAERPRLGRTLGVHGFVGFALVTWLLLGGYLGVDRLDPVRSALGGLGWGLFALGWGTVRRAGSIPEEDPHVLTGQALSPRNRLPAGAEPLIGVVVLTALVPPVLAWRVVRSEHALLGQAAALLCSVAILNAGALVALGRGQVRAAKSVRQRLASATRSAGALALLLILGLVGLLIR